MHLQLDGVGSPLALLLIFVLLGLAVHRLTTRPTGRQDFEEAYATTGARLVDSLLVVCDGVVQILRGRPWQRQVGRMIWAVLSLLLCSLVPLVILVTGSIDAVNAHAFAFGIGGLIWSCVLEIAGSPGRTKAVVGRDMFDVKVWAVILVLCLADLVLLAIAPSIPASHTTGDFGTVGAAFVALADLVSLAFGLAFSAMSAHPLRDP